MSQANPTYTSGGQTKPDQTRADRQSGSILMALAGRTDIHFTNEGWRQFRAQGADGSHYNPVVAAAAPPPAVPIPRGEYEYTCTPSLPPGSTPMLLHGYNTHRKLVMCEGKRRRTVEFVVIKVSICIKIQLEKKSG